MDDSKELLYRSFDDELNKSEATNLKEALSNSKELRNEKESIEEVRNILGQNQFQFNDGFADRVLSTLEANNAVFVVGLYNLFKRVAITGIAAIIVLLISIYFIDGSIETDSFYGLTSYIPEDADLTFFEIEQAE